VTQPSDLLVGSRGKLDRGHEHAEALQAEATRYLQRRPYTFFIESNADGTDQRLKVRVSSTPDMRKWALTVGDCLHNFRSALDHLIYAMAIHASGSDPPPRHDKLQFSIASAPERFQAWRLGEMEKDTTIRAAVEAVQPYGGNAGDGRALLLLADLNNTDKHRLLHVLNVAIVAADHLVSGLPAEQEYSVEPTLEPLVDGATLLRITSPAPSPKVEVNTQGTVAVAIRHTEDVAGNVIVKGGEASELFSLLRDIGAECHRVIGELEQFTR
jgi:hypothetical protein